MSGQKGAVGDNHPNDARPVRCGLTRVSPNWSCSVDTETAGVERLQGPWLRGLRGSPPPVSGGSCHLATRPASWGRAHLLPNRSAHEPSKAYHAVHSPRARAHITGGGTTTSPGGLVGVPNHIPSTEPIVGRSS